MKIKKLAAAVITIGIVFCILIFAMKQKPPLEYISMSASWIYGYADVADLTVHSDVIALIHVDGLDSSQGGRVPSSIFSVTVKEGLLGCESGDELQIYMIGAKVGNQLYENEKVSSLHNAALPYVNRRVAAARTEAPVRVANIDVSNESYDEIKTEILDNLP